MTIDVYHYYGGDLSPSSTGDLLLADQPTTGVQRIYRRLLTNPQLTNSTGERTASPDYPWAPTYGAGLGRKVGSPGNTPAIKALIKGQMLKESAVKQSPVPAISVSQVGNTSSITIQYTDSTTSKQQTVDFDVTQ
jgi:hypothetical protein